jgi:hypothetical protein
MSYGEFTLEILRREHGIQVKDQALFLVRSLRELDQHGTAESAA